MRVWKTQESTSHIQKFIDLIKMSVPLSYPVINMHNLENFFRIGAISMNIGGGSGATRIDGDRRKAVGLHLVGDGAEHEAAHDIDLI